MAGAAQRLIKPIGGRGVRRIAPAVAAPAGYVASAVDFDGTGGNFTEFGTLTAGSSSPSD